MQAAFRSIGAAAAALCILCCLCAARITSRDRLEEEKTEHLRSYTSMQPAPADTSCPPQTVSEEAAEGGPGAEPAGGEGLCARTQDRHLSVPEGAAVVNFPAVLEEAPDTRAWIRIPGTNIHYPVVQAADNEYYLTHGPDGTLSRSGAIFLSAANAPDFTDRNTVLYGHRMNSGTMFAQLHRFTSQDFLRSNPYIHITRTDGTVLTYEIFLVQKVPAGGNSAAYTQQFAGDKAFSDWLLRKRSGVLCARGSAVAAGSRVLTLSTCVRGDGNTRLVVQACLRNETGRKETG